MAASAVAATLIASPPFTTALTKAEFSKPPLRNARICRGYVELGSAGVRRGGWSESDEKLERLCVGENKKKHCHHAGTALHVSANAAPAASEEQIVRPPTASQGMRPPFNVLITGSTKGIGFALAKEFLREGDNVIICSRSEERVQSALKDLAEEFGQGRVRGTVCNVSEAQSVESLASFAKAEFGYVDIWINNAGSNAYTYKPLVDTDDKDIAEIVQTNTLGVMLCCRQAIRTMRAQTRGGHIFNMDGAGADGNATPRFSVYGATKRSLAQFTKSLQAELRMQGVKNVVVHDLSPGMVTTDLLMSGVDTPQSKFFINVLAEPPNEVANYLVPRIRAVAESQKKTSTYIRFLTGPKAYRQILAVWPLVYKLFETNNSSFIPFFMLSSPYFDPLSAPRTNFKLLAGQRILFKVRKDRIFYLLLWPGSGSFSFSLDSLSASGLRLVGLRGGFFACLLKSTMTAFGIFFAFWSNLARPVKGRSLPMSPIFLSHGDEILGFGPGAEETFRLEIILALESTESATVEMNVPTEVQLSMSEYLWINLITLVEYFRIDSSGFFLRAMASKSWRNKCTSSVGLPWNSAYSRT
ncbi:hypothetical protein R1sor_015647 [Riccia sorocarpa]|uniref:Chlorophyll(Ide) b reductase NOL, chloroplastic n=1 Tax=Riccia sorocarpa TaxID=122646 RepID=A0ABD3HD60_9MARC